MKVTDLNGCEIEVTDLKEATRIAKRYTEYRHKGKGFSDFDKRKNPYWMEIHEKLTSIKERLNDN